MPSGPVGILLAAGIGHRYDPSGASLKLLVPCRRGPHVGMPLVRAAADPLQRALAAVFAVVGPASRPHQRELHALLAESGSQLVVCDDPERGIGHSIACGVAASSDASGWVIALGDMPAIQTSTVESIRDALRAGHATAIPTFKGRRGHPVGFGRQCCERLLALDGDIGAREVLDQFPPYRLDVSDPDILYDVDTAEP